jgi:TPR repeat protein
MKIEKTVFISYRRTNISWALAIFQNLTLHGYDVFFDFNGLASGDFETSIIENIKARAHFLVLLTPTALERCTEPSDWLRREIETAVECQRNIVPLMLEGFTFDSSMSSGSTPEVLTMLRRYNGLSVPPEYFSEAIDRLRLKYLSVPMEMVLHPSSRTAQRAAAEQRAVAVSAPAVGSEELSAEQAFERGFAATDPDEKVELYSEAIRLKPHYAEAFLKRAAARKEKSDSDGALSDCSQAIRLKPNYVDALYLRCVLRAQANDLDGALFDCGEVIRLNPNHAYAFYVRGLVQKGKGNVDRALEDYSETIRLKPDFAEAFYERGGLRLSQGDVNGALEDYTNAIRLKPAYINNLWELQIDYSQRARLYRSSADEGYSPAQYELGNLYESGLGVEQDASKAADYYKLACTQAHIGAQARLGTMYEDGVGVAQNYHQAAQLYRLAANRGDANAQRRLGMLYERGLGVRQDSAEAARLYTMAGDQGEILALQRLASLYDRGQGVRKDSTEAANILRKAAILETEDLEKRLLFIANRKERALARQEFEKVRFYSDEEAKEREKLRDLRKKFNLP